MLRTEARGSSDPLVGDLQAEPGAHGSGVHRGSDTTRRLEDLEPSFRSALGLLFESVRGLPDLQFRCQVCGQQTAYLVLAASSGVGGDEETRTPDPLLAKEMLFQLSYAPSRPDGHRTWWWAFLDSNQRPLPYQGSALTN